MRFIQVDPLPQPRWRQSGTTGSSRMYSTRRIDQLARRGMKGEQERTEPTHALWNDRGGYSARERPASNNT